MDGGCKPRRSGPLDRFSPDPHLVVVGWRSEADRDGTLGPGHRVGPYQFFVAVLRDDPGAQPLRDRRGGGSELAHLLQLPAPGLALDEGIPC